MGICAVCCVNIRVPIRVPPPVTCVSRIAWCCVLRAAGARAWVCDMWMCVPVRERARLTGKCDVNVKQTIVSLPRWRCELIWLAAIEFLAQPSVVHKRMVRVRFPPFSLSMHLYGVGTGFQRDHTYTHAHVNLTNVYASSPIQSISLTYTVCPAPVATACCQPVPISLWKCPRFLFWEHD